jgi:hypothetical protein
MKFPITLMTLLFTLASALPHAINTDIPQSVTQSIVTLRLITTKHPHNTDLQTQNPNEQKASPDKILSVIVGQTLSRETKPLPLIGIEVLDVSEGVSLSGKKVDPRIVMCTASKDFSHRTVGASMLGSGPEVFDGGEKVAITRIECF